MEKFGINACGEGDRRYSREYGRVVFDWGVQRAARLDSLPEAPVFYKPGRFFLRKLLYTDDNGDNRRCDIFVPCLREKELT